MGWRRRPVAEARPIPGREMVRWPLLAWGLPLLPLALLIAAWMEPEQRLGLWLQPNVPVTSSPFTLEGGRWGAPVLDLQVSLPPNSSATYAIDLVDGAARPLLRLRKEAWREVTAWQDEGERGIEDLADSGITLDLRPRQSGPHRLRLELQQVLDAAGRPLDTGLPARLRVRNHVLDAPLLLLTAAVTALLVGMGLRATSQEGRQRCHCRRDDRRLDCRLVAGGAGLVRLQVRASYEGGLPSQVLEVAPELQLQVFDAQGSRVLDCRLPLAARRRSDGHHWWSVEGRLHLRFAEAESRRLRVLLPRRLRGTRAALEWGELTVLDGCRVLWPEPVLPVSGPG